MSDIACDSSTTSNLRRRVLELTDPVAPAPFARAGRLLVWGTVLLLLLPTLAMEFGPDQGTFSIVAQKLLGGAALYRDVIDTKPPLIYHMYAGAISVFGGGAFSIRAMDVLLQLLTCWMLWRMVKRVGGGELAAGLTIIAYLLIQLAQVAQAETESYTGLFALPMIWGAGFRRTRGWLVGAGVCAGALTLMEYTLGIALVGGLAVIWFADEELGARLKMIGWLLLGWVLAMVPLALYLAQPGVFDSYRTVMSFAVHSTASGWTNLPAYAKGLTSTLPWKFTEDFSLLFCIAAALGVGMAARVLGRDGALSEPVTSVRLLRAATVCLALLMATVAFEGRYHYQMQRMTVFVALLAGFGLVWGLRRIAEMPPICSRTLRLLALGSAGAVALYLSPLVAALWRTEAVSAQSIARLAGYSILPQIERDSSYLQAEEIAQRVRTQRAAGDELFVLSDDAGTVYERCGILPRMRLMHSAMYTAPFSPREWREEAEGFLVEHLPRFVVVQVGEHGLVSGGLEDVLVTLRSNPAVAAVLDNRYREAGRTHHLLLFERVP